VPARHAEAVESTKGIFCGFAMRQQKQMEVQQEGNKEGESTCKGALFLMNEALNMKALNMI